jgi:hypothetical protein
MLNGEVLKDGNVERDLEVQNASMPRLQMEAVVVAEWTRRNQPESRKESLTGSFLVMYIDQELPAKGVLIAKLGT